MTITTRTDLRKYLDNCIQNYDIASSEYDTVLDALTSRVYAALPDDPDKVKTYLESLDMESLMADLY